jgi:hypothetical protein
MTAKGNCAFRFCGNFRFALVTSYVSLLTRLTRLTSSRVMSHV